MKKEIIALALIVAFSLPIKGVSNSDYDINDAAHFKYYENDENIIYWYEWWYANIKSEDKAIMISFITLGNLNDPLLSIAGVFTTFFNNNDFVSDFISFPFIPYHLDYEKCNVTILNNRFYEEDGKFFVEYNGKDLKIYLEIWPEGKRFGSYCNIDEWQWMSWYVASPYGKGRARVVYNGNEYYFEGNTYHDHNWGIAKFYDLKWDWGEFSLGNIALIYGFVEGKEMQGGVHIVSQNEHIFIPYRKSNMEILEWRRFGLENKPKKILLTANDENINLEMNIEMYKFSYIIDELKLKPYLLGKASGILKIYNEKIIFSGIKGFYEHR
ncbi:MAG: hypothetical protein H5T44_02635 [Thermoplasmatales archaeon]|nr:hypothetical protein [Thermoplasmatales archaeon]